MISKIHTRQVLSRDLLQRLWPNVASQELDNLLQSINSEVTPVFELTPNNPANLILNVSPRVISNSQSGYNKTMPPIKVGVPNLGASPTVTFPSSDGGNVVASPGNTIVLNCPSGNYVAILIAVKKDNTLFISQGTPQTSVDLALNNAPKIKTGTVPIGIVVVRNISGVIQNIDAQSIYQFGSGAGGDC